jgi:predicted nucleic acid-binding protein
MGLILDTCVFLEATLEHTPIDYTQWQRFGNAYMCATSVSDLLIGVQMAKNASLAMKRSAYVEAIITRISVLPFTEEVARNHAKIYAILVKREELIPSHDLIVAATALTHDYAIVTKDVANFNKIPGLKIISYETSEV